MNKQQQIFAAFLATLYLGAVFIQAAPSQKNLNKIAKIDGSDNLLPEESRNEQEISDDLTAADLDLDGAASEESDSDAEDESADASDPSELRWNRNQDGSEPAGLDSNIENAKIHMSPKDMATAAGHHHHHGHYPHGWLKMGAETGHKGAFKWHDKHPVGGKGRR